MYVKEEVTQRGQRKKGVRREGEMVIEKGYLLDVCGFIPHFQHN